MCGCCSVAASWISRLNRSTLTPAASSGGSTLTTTLRPSAVSVGEEDARHAAAAELALERVGVSQRVLKLNVHGDCRRETVLRAARAIVGLRYL